MKIKCMGCGCIKDTKKLEVYPYPEDSIVDDAPIDPIFKLDCAPQDDVPENSTYKKVLICHECFHRLHPDMWIGSKCWKAINPIIRFEDLPVCTKEYLNKDKS